MNALYWKWDKAIPKEVCEKMLADIKNMDLNVGTVFDNNMQVIDITQRNNKTAFLPINHWFEGILVNHARYANFSAGWNFSINGNEQVQVTSYRAGEKYEWHQDVNIVNNQPVQRKVSVVCKLSDAKDFSGGGLFIEGIDESLLTDQGDVLVFPSFVKHKAAEVTGGHRTTLVCWTLGDKFK